MASTDVQVIEFPAPGTAPSYQPTAAAVAIQSADDYTAVAERLKVIKTFQRSVETFFKPLKEKAQAAHRALCDAERKALQPAVGDEARIKAALTAYDTEQARIRRDEQQRLEREAREREEAARLEQAAALEREAHATGDVGMREAAVALIEAPIPIAPVVPVTPPAPKVDGLSYRELFRAEVIDLPTLVKAAAAGECSIALVCANQTALDGLARSLKRALSVPGVRLVVEKIPVARVR